MDQPTETGKPAARMKAWMSLYRQGPSSDAWLPVLESVAAAGVHVFILCVGISIHGHTPFFSSSLTWQCAKSESHSASLRTHNFCML